MAPFNDFGPRILSPPVSIEWAGWRSDTYTLQRNGWDLSWESHISTHSQRLLLRHAGMTLYGVTQDVDEGIFTSRDDRWLREMMLSVQYLVSDMRVDIQINPSYFSPIDATPRVIESPRSIEDFGLFKTVARDAPEIYLAEASLEEVLEYALKKQEPKQAEIREQILRERDRQTTPDNVVQFPDANIRAQLMAVSR